MKASELSEKVEGLPTGFPLLDSLFGVGGLPFKKISEFSGSWSVGKSTLAMQIIASAQREKKECLWVDSEFSWSNQYAQTLGVDCENLELIREEYAEKNLDELEKWASSHKNGVVVLDSIGSLLPKEEAEKGNEGRSIGLQARLIGSFTRRIIPILDKQNIALLVVNHTFTDLNTGRLSSSGGKKLEYARSVWMTIKRSYGGQVLRDKDGKKTEILMEIEVRKNKLAATEGMKASIPFFMGSGFMQGEDKFESLIESGKLTKKGNSYFFEGEKVAVGINKAKEWARKQI